jgi:hypothetical protein
MDAIVRASLETAYRNADYRVQLPLGDLLLKADRPCESSDRRLREEAGVHSHWAILTPCNPGSQALPAEVNRKRLDQLLQMLQALGIRHFSSVNRDPQRRWRWPDEPGFLLCDAPAGEAERLGLRFRQHAILGGLLGQAPRLQWLTG